MLNQTLPAALALLAGEQRPQVTHQAGAAEADAVRAAYAAAGIDAEVLPFIDDMPLRLAACDLMVCRAGAITVSELCAAGVPAILVPLVVSTTAHQRDNAAWMAQHGAALHLPQAELTPQRLAELLRGLDRAAAAGDGHAGAPLARPHAAARVADEIEGSCAMKHAVKHIHFVATATVPTKRSRRAEVAMKHAVKHIHFVGIGGAGMSAIAEILHQQGYASPAPTRPPAP